ncbi:MAG: alpha/beta hydrolase [Candidatus Hodarchaeales archaeon]|jgi:carboxylesterase
MTKTICVGHGTTPEDLKNTTWRDWTSYVLEEVDKSLEEFNNKVIIAGLSLGGLLSLYALINRPNLLAGVTLATPINVINFYRGILLRIPKIGFWMQDKSGRMDIFDKEMKKNHRSYPKFHTSNGKSIFYLLKYVKKNIQNINQPLIVFHSKNDQILRYENAYYIYKNVKSRKKELKLVEKSSHVLTKDYDRKLIFQNINDFIQYL